jgi:hypothetical protein
LTKPAIIIDESARPVYGIKFSGVVPRADVARYIAWQESVLQRSERYVVIADLGDIDVRDNHTLKEGEAYLQNKHGREIRALSAGSVLVVESALVRTALRAWLTFNPLASGQPVLVKSPDEARVVADALLRVSTG